MKKAIGIIVLGLLWCNISFASCGEDIEGGWEYFNNKNRVKYTFKNTSSNSITITRVGLKTANGEKVVENDTEVHVKPFGIAYQTFYVGNINLDVVDTGYRACRYGTPQKTTQTHTPKEEKSGAKKLLEKIFGD